MNLAIVLYQPYPHGFACTNRIHYYAQGVNELGGKSRVYIPIPTEYNEQSAKNYLTKGVHKTVSFEYTCGTPIRPGNFIARRFSYFKGPLSAALGLFKKRNEIDAILIVSNKLIPILFFKIISIILNVKYIIEKSELPFYNKQPRYFPQKIYQHLYTKYVYKLFDGIIAISKPLVDYFNPRIKKTARIITVPVIVDPGEFLGGRNVETVPYIAYCGNFTQSQDGIVHLIEAFKIVSEQYTQLRLRLIGEPTKKEDKYIIKKLINDLSLSEKIDLLGYVDRNILVESLMSAKALVLAKPKSLQADYCFPSKLAEYLITSTPVVVTDVGVISDYLSDEENAFLAEPDSVISIADKIIQVLSNDELAKDVGKQGRKIALDNFSYQNQVARIIRFIADLPGKT